MLRVLRNGLLAGILGVVLLSCQVPIHRQTRFSMSTTLTVLVSAARDPDWQGLFDFVDRKAWQFDHRQEGSPISRLNRDRGGNPPEEVLRVLAIAQSVAGASGGAFDPTILPLTRLWSFDTGGVLPAEQQIEHTRRQVDYSKAVLAGDGTVTLAEEAVIDLGGIAKGAVVDLIADHLDGLGYEDFLIDAGGDILVSGLKQGRNPWRIAIRHPRDSQAVLGVLDVGEKGSRIAVVTSGDYERYFESDGRRYHHILDPRSGYPAGELVSVTIIAPECTLADALSTAVFVLGPGEGMDLLAKYPGSEGLLIAEREGKLIAWKTSGFPGELDALDYVTK
ncbi:MAG: FAD:protein FMN transferase [Spirochaetaceae bacterium]|nr:MAG: FAD:protein FMN transferase [Spirochaetaceae bacterium]